MSLEHILLGLLREPATGYDIKNAFSASVRHFWSAELSQIYPTLKRLEQRRMLRSRLEPSPKGPNRRVYTLTEEGRADCCAGCAAVPRSARSASPTSPSSTSWTRSATCARPARS